VIRTVAIVVSITITGGYGGMAQDVKGPELPSLQIGQRVQTLLEQATVWGQPEWIGHYS